MTLRSVEALYELSTPAGADDGKRKDRNHYEGERAEQCFERDDTPVLRHHHSARALCTEPLKIICIFAGSWTCDTSLGQTSSIC
jgi:hypothetical protein